MNVRRLLVLGLFACIVVGPLTAQTPKKADEKSDLKFQEFSPDGKFKVLMPGRPKDSSVGKGGLDINIWVVEKGANCVFLVSSTAMPIDKKLTDDEVADTLDKSATGQVNGMNGKETKRREITLEKKHQGLQVEAEIPKGANAPNGARSISRIFLIDARLYQIMALGDEEFVKSKDVQKFLDSFSVKMDR